MKIFYLLSIIVVMSSGADSSADAKFEMNEKKYIYSFAFSSSLPEDTLLNILYDFNHLRRYSSQAADAKLLYASSNYHDIELHLKYLIYSSRSAYRRTIQPDSARVKIEMLNSIQSSNLFPRIVKSYAEYRLHTEDNVAVVEYLQQVTFDKDANWLFRKILKDRLFEFTEELVGYIRKLE